MGALIRTTNVDPTGGSMNIERAVFVNDHFRGLYTLERCDTYNLYNLKNKWCLRCKGETKFHWKKDIWETDMILAFRPAVVAEFVRLDLKVASNFIPLHESDMHEY